MKRFLAVMCLVVFSLSASSVEAGPIRKAGKAVAAVGRVVAKVLPRNRNHRTVYVYQVKAPGK